MTPLDPRPSRVFESPVGARVVVDGRSYLWFGGTAYLGLQSRPEVIAAACEAVQRYGVHPGSARSGYGTTPPLLAAEAELAEFFGSESALLTASGWSATSLLLAAEDTATARAFCDEHLHASAREALLAEQIPLHAFAHRDADAARSSIATHLRRGEAPWIVTDGVFAATGAIAPLRDYVTIAQGHPGSRVLVDDAHGFGVLGVGGVGSIGLHHGLDARHNADSREVAGAIRVAGTASKALGGHGGVVTGPRAFVERIRGRSAWSAGSTPPSIANAAATARAVRLAHEEPRLRAQLAVNLAALRERLAGLGLTPPATPAPIVALPFPAAEATRLHEALADSGILVPKLCDYGGVRGCVLRIAVFATHELSHFDELCAALRRCL
jgi:7-keto-8-aminopelargonate synthetase-like enzyme